MITMKEAINKVVKGQNLTTSEAKDVATMLLGGDATQAQIGSFLTALRMKGETIDEIVGCASVLKDKAEKVITKSGNHLDLVGTGGDGTNTFNISTTSAFVACGAGLSIAKHGNRAVSSQSGSIDVLEALGINIMLESDNVSKCVDEIGIGFMFAQVFHKSMKNVGIARKDMGIRTIFNILGPLSNPSDAKAQLIGVFSRDLTRPLAEAMRTMGVKRGLVACGCDGMDEITTTGETYISEIKNDVVIDYTITPEQFGFKKSTPNDLLGFDASGNAKITRAILGGELGFKRDIVCLNAGAALYIGGIANSIEEGVKLAKNSIDSGNAMKKLEEAINLTNKLK